MQNILYVKQKYNIKYFIFFIYEILLVEILADTM